MSTVQEQEEQERSPVELDMECANRVVKFLGEQPWARVNPIIEDLQEILTGYVSNYNLLIECTKARNS